MDKKYTLIATTAFGLESITAREIENLGYTDKTTENGRVTFKGDEHAIARANMWLRTSDRILIKIGEFKALTFDELFDQTKALPWDEWLPEDAEFPVTGRSVRSGLFSVSDCQAIVKKAIVEKMKTKYNRTQFEETGPKYKIEVALLKDVATLTIDTSGLGLNKRGYRERAGDAPIKETMAAALLMLTYWKRGRILVDPLCGSGTIPIEAAMIAKNMAPGIKRTFLAENWGNFSPKIWEDARQEANDLLVRENISEIYGSDLDPKAIDLSILHAKEAGLSDSIKFKQMALKDFYSKESFGFIVTNPPYGERLGEIKQVEYLYREMAEVFKRLDNWSYYIITSHPTFERIFGRKADKRRKLYNGTLECQYYQFLSKEKPNRQ